MTNDDLALTLLLADIDQVLTAHKADTAQVVAAGQQLILSAFGQIVDECPAADHAALADSLAEALRRRLQERIATPPPPMAEA